MLKSMFIFCMDQQAGLEITGVRGGASGAVQETSKRLLVPEAYVWWSDLQPADPVKKKKKRGSKKGKKGKKGTRLCPSDIPCFLPHSRLCEVVSLHTCVLSYMYKYVEGCDLSCAYHEPTVMIGHITVGSR